MAQGVQKRSAWAKLEKSRAEFMSKCGFGLGWAWAWAANGEADSGYIEMF